MRSERTAAKASSALSAAPGEETPASIDGRAELTNLHAGALVVYLGEGADVARVLLRVPGDQPHQTAPVTARLLTGWPYQCAIFPGLAPGTYTVHGVTGREAIVTVEAERALAIRR